MNVFITKLFVLNKFHKGYKFAEVYMYFLIDIIIAILLWIHTLQHNNITEITLHPF